MHYLPMAELGHVRLTLVVLSKRVFTARKCKVGPGQAGDGGKCHRCMFPPVHSLCNSFGIPELADSGTGSMKLVSQKFLRMDEFSRVERPPRAFLGGRGSRR